jgi:N-methylhydantoinase A/oxoprolinase/acetone carboxylase beta subunit
VTIALGIDTGGTYTDAALVDQSSGEVLASAKALTTYHDLSIGIGQAVAAALAATPGLQAGDIGMVALSTTLATNAIVEGRGSPICLLLIGYDTELVRQFGFERELGTQDVVYLGGGHDAAGDEVAPLDEEGARRAILDYRERVEAFAVSGYFSVRNPAHELRVRALVGELTGLPVTCGHELTTRLNAVRRATTTALNARLIPLLRELIATLRRTLDQQGILAPLMVVKGDGSLVRAEWALQRPVETILAGPAASLVGAWHLAGSRDGWVVDMGGTTTDIAMLRDGRPRLSEHGAQVGHWRTMVEAVDVQTAGLGGDSQVSIDKEGRLAVGPRRVVPLCLLASEHPELLDELRRQVAAGGRDRLAGEFVLSQRRANVALPNVERSLLEEVAVHPQSLQALARRHGPLASYRVAGLEARRLLLRAGFTPTDALHVLGRFDHWNVEAARLGAQLLAARLRLTADELCRRVVEWVSQRVATELVSKALSDDGVAARWDQGSTGAALLARALNGAALDGGASYDLECRLTLRLPVIAIGAPVAAYLPAATERLHTGLIIPPHAEVANAVGAVAGGVVQQVPATIYPSLAGDHFRLHLPDSVCDFPTLAEAVAFAQAALMARAEALAHLAGAAQVEVRLECEDITAPLAEDYGMEVYLETRLMATATGRPGVAR